MTSILPKLYKDTIVDTLVTEYSLPNVMAAPKITKIVVNMGTGDTAKNKEPWAKLQQDFAAMTGQKPKITQSRQSIAGFGLREGQPVGLAVTLRGEKMYSFLEKVISIVLPRLRDFRGVPRKGFDGFGNYTLAFTEHIVFPEIDFAKVDRPRGFEMTVVVKNGTPERSLRMLELFGMPFEKVEN
jgi:large subunit ribosomal protein L5